MKFVNTVLIILFVGSQLFAQTYFKTSLKQGPYKVGFKAGVHYDLGRPPIKGQFTAFQQGRAIHISVWYPSTTKANHPAMMFSEYMDEISRMVNPKEVTKRTRTESIGQMNVLLSQLGGDSSLLKKHLAPLLNSSTHAFRNAAIHSGSFPILMYPESPHLNNILSEYLASYGYIVVSVSRHGTTTPEFEWQTVRGIETLVQDCQFALAVVRKEFKSAGQGLAVMGTGMNASAGLAWMMRNPTINALISLEGGILTGYEYGLIQKSPYFNITEVTRPMLVIHSPHESVKPDYINHYKYADRYMLSLPYMREFYYLNFGIWEKTIPGILGLAPGDTKSGFEWMARYTLGFLDWKLKMGEHGKILFETSPEGNGVPADLMDSSVKYAIEVPLTEAELLTMKDQEGFNAMLQEVEKSIKQDTAAYGFETYVSIGEKLIAAQQYKEGTEWAEVFRRIFPKSVYGYTMAGRCYIALEKKENALAMYSNALNLLATDSYVNPSDKPQLKERIEQRLQQLSQ
ncbi:MAG: hypothetical protein C0490_15540 [Marivirga sp.]|nr:hypothetical protein [Marivirga sp.]